MDFYNTISFERGDPLFALFCANLQYFCPHIPEGAYAALFHSLRNRPSHGGGMLRMDDGCRSQLAGIRAQPGFILTFHVGDYSMLPRLLCEEGFNIALLASSQVLAAQQAALTKQHGRLRETDDRTGLFITIDAGQRSSLLQTRRALNQGYHILVYVDGNTGAHGATAPAKHCMHVPFFNGIILQRTAIATLSYNWQVALYPMMMRTRDGVCRLQLSGLCFPDAAPSVEDYAQHTFVQLYVLLQEILRHDISAWEGWLYFLERPSRRSTCWNRFYYRFTDAVLWPLQIDGRYYALDSRYMDSRSIRKPTFDRLCRSKKKRIFRNMTSIMK